VGSTVASPYFAALMLRTKEAVSFSTSKGSAELGRTLDGKIAEHFANRDDVGMMRQVRLLPPPPSLSGQ